MLRVTVVFVGKVRTPGLASAIEEYENRLQHYFRFQAIGVPAAQYPDNRAEDAKAEEGEALLRRIPKDDSLIALTRTGQRWTTRKLVEHIDRTQTYGGGGLTFAIGGAHGLGTAVIAHAKHGVSLSDMTLPHEMARLFMTEQIYRAGTLLRGEQYHKGP